MSNKVLKNSIIYIIGDVVNKAVPFLMLPILTKYLTPSDYGIIASFSSFVGFLTIFIGISLHGAINVAFFKLEKEALRVYIVNAFLILVFTTFIVFFIIFIFDKNISEKLLLDKEWLYIGILVSLSQFITLLNTTLWIAEQNPKAYSIYQFSQTLLITILSILLVVGYNLEWEGRIIAIIISAVSFALISLILLKKRDYFIFEYRVEDIKHLLKFGIPMIPHQLAGWIRTSGDTILLISMVGANATGLFAVGYQIAMIMTVLTTAFNRAWSPYLYSQLKIKNNEDKKIKIVKYTYLYFIGIFILFILLYFFSSLIFQYFLDKKFFDSIKFVIYILLANMFNGMYFMVVNYLFFTQKTDKLAIITFSISLIHLLLSYSLIKYYGAIGVAYSGVISMFLTFLSVWFYSNRYYPMPWNLRGLDVR